MLGYFTQFPSWSDKIIPTMLYYKGRYLHLIFSNGRHVHFLIEWGVSSKGTNILILAWQTASVQPQHCMMLSSLSWILLWNNKECVYLEEQGFIVSFWISPQSTLEKMQKQYLRNQFPLSTKLHIASLCTARHNGERGAQKHWWRCFHWWSKIVCKVAGTPRSLYTVNSVKICVVFMDLICVERWSNWMNKALLFHYQCIGINAPFSDCIHDCLYDKSERTHFSLHYLYLA